MERSGEEPGNELGTIWIEGEKDGPISTFLALLSACERSEEETTGNEKRLPVLKFKVYGTDLSLQAQVRKCSS